MADSTTGNPAAGGGRFRTTHWSAVVRAGQGDSSESLPALNELCRAYWYPVYAFARRQGHAPAEAEDLAQGFFTRLLERDFLARADAEKGRFRTFLLTALRRFMANEWNRQHRQRRGGFHANISLDAAWAESRYDAEPAGNDSPDALYDRHWAQTLLEQVLQRLEGEYAASGRTRLFGRLEACLAREENSFRYADIAAELGLTEAAVKMAMQRLRARYRAILREEIARTVASTDDVEAELRDLFAAFRS